MADERMCFLISFASPTLIEYARPIKSSTFKLKKSVENIWIEPCENDFQQ